MAEPKAAAQENQDAPNEEMVRLIRDAEITEVACYETCLHIERHLSRPPQGGERSNKCWQHTHDLNKCMPKATFLPSHPPTPTATFQNNDATTQTTHLGALSDLRHCCYCPSLTIPKPSGYKEAQTQYTLPCRDCKHVSHPCCHCMGGLHSPYAHAGYLKAWRKGGLCVDDGVQCWHDCIDGSRRHHYQQPLQAVSAYVENQSGFAATACALPLHINAQKVVALFRTADTMGRVCCTVIGTDQPGLTRFPSSMDAYATLTAGRGTSCCCRCCCCCCCCCCTRWRDRANVFMAPPLQLPTALHPVTAASMALPTELNAQLCFMRPTILPGADSTLPDPTVAAWPAGFGYAAVGLLLLTMLLAQLPGKHEPQKQARVTVIKLYRMIMKQFSLAEKDEKIRLAMLLQERLHCEPTESPIQTGYAQRTKKRRTRKRRNRFDPADGLNIHPRTSAAGGQLDRAYTMLRQLRLMSRHKQASYVKLANSRKCTFYLRQLQYLSVPHNHRGRAAHNTRLVFQ